MIVPDRAETRSSRGSGSLLATIERSRPLGRDVPSLSAFLPASGPTGGFTEDDAWPTIQLASQPKDRECHEPPRAIPLSPRFCWQHRCSAHVVVNQPRRPTPRRARSQIPSSPVVRRVRQCRTPGGEVTRNPTRTSNGATKPQTEARCIEDPHLTAGLRLAAGPAMRPRGVNDPH